MLKICKENEKISTLWPSVRETTDLCCRVKPERGWGKHRALIYHLFNRISPSKCVFVTFQHGKFQ